MLLGAGTRLDTTALANEVANTLDRQPEVREQPSDIVMLEAEEQMLNMGFAVPHSRGLVLRTSDRQLRLLGESVEHSLSRCPTQIRGKHSFGFRVARRVLFDRSNSLV